MCSCLGLMETGDLLVFFITCSYLTARWEMPLLRL